MTDLTTNPVSQSGSVGSGATSPVVEATSEGADQLISSDFETFLKMLSAQLENQDPLNPLQSTDFAVQLATFSGVEQQVLTNQHLEELTGQLNASSISSLSNWIGTEVLTELDVPFDGTPVDLLTTPEPGAERAILVVQNASDDVVGRLEVPVAGGIVQWAGETDSGALDQGVYRFSIQSIDADGLTMSQLVAPAYRTVAEVLPNGEDPVLALEGGGVISTAEVVALRRSQSE